MRSTCPQSITFIFCFFIDAGPHFPIGQSSNGRNLEAVEMVYAFLYSASGDEFQRHAANHLGMSQSSVCHSIDVCLNVFYDILVPLYNVLPTEQEAKNEAEELHLRSGFPPIGWGCIDGTHFPVSFPHKLTSFLLLYESGFIFHTRSDLLITRTPMIIT